MKILVTGSDGFIGKNLVVKLQELNKYEIIHFTEHSTSQDLTKAINEASFIFHLAGINRPKDIGEFDVGNAGFTQELCEQIVVSGKKIPIVFSSSIQAALDNPYGVSKRKGEEALLNYSKQQNVPVYLYRLPNVFGKWCRPNYNSAVATFCHNIANDLPIQINDASAQIKLVYIDDVVTAFANVLQHGAAEEFCEVNPVYSVTVGELASTIRAFKESRNNLMIEPVGNGLIRALYSTYVSYLQPKQFAYELSSSNDPRGSFVEILKTSNSGQFSFFTALPGVTRGGHYHHTKTEKFLVAKGKARFCFRSILTNEKYDYCVSGDKPEVIETVPGWVHDITNIGRDEIIVFLWANEVFDKANPDTFASSVK